MANTAAAQNTYLSGDVPGLLNHVRAIHKPYGDHGRCLTDGERWPCDAFLLADALDAANARADRQHAAVRRLGLTNVVGVSGTPLRLCRLCQGSWPEGTAEDHQSDCLAVRGQGGY